MLRYAPLVIVSLSFLSCGGPTTPDEPPDIRGAHYGLWSTHERTGDAGYTASSLLSAMIEITEQEGERVAGRYVIAEEGFENAGTLAGRVNVNGWLEFTVTTRDGSSDPLGSDHRFDCRLLGADDVYAGSVIGGFLVSRHFTLKCGDAALFVTSGFKEY